MNNPMQLEHKIDETIMLLRQIKDNFGWMPIIGEFAVKFFKDKEYKFYLKFQKYEMDLSAMAIIELMAGNAIVIDNKGRQIYPIESNEE